jgi:hypothetical protein
VRNLFGAHRTFSHGFTADLTRGEVWTLRNLFRTGTEPLQKLSVTPLSEEKSPWSTLFIQKKAALASSEEALSIALVDTGVSEDVFVSECIDFTREGRVEGVCEDRNGHGTALARRAFAAEELVPTRERVRELAAYKACDVNGECWEDDIVAALSFAVEREADVILLAPEPHAFSPSLATERERAVSSYAIVHAIELP